MVRLRDQTIGALNLLSARPPPQAKGLLAEHGHVDMQTAFGALRAYARSSHLTIGLVAGSLVSRQLAPR
jgi:AmiR/NasT family two-component response regulator